MHYQVCRLKKLESREFHPCLRKVSRNLFLSNYFNQYQLSEPTRQHMIDWVIKYLTILFRTNWWYKRCFQICGISSLDPGKVGNGALFKQCMGKALHNLEGDDANEIDDSFCMVNILLRNKSLWLHIILFPAYSPSICAKVFICVIIRAK